MDGLDKQQRIFAYALAASLVLHAVVLALRTPEFSGAAEFASAPIVAHIVRVEPVEPAPQPTAPREAEVAPPRPRVEKPKPRPAERPAPITAPAPAPVPAATVPPAPEQAPAAPQPAAEAPRVAGPPAAHPGAPDPMNVGRYRQMLINEARRYNDYPPRAQDNGWEGDVEVRIVVSSSGQVSEIKVHQASGHTVLDEQALKTLRQAAQRVPVPPALRGQEFAFVVRMVYQLKN